MSYRTLNAFTIKPTWPSSWGTTGAKLVIVLDRDVVSEDGVQYQGAENLGEGTALDSLGFYFSSDITVAGGVATADSIANLPTTDTSTPANSARYYAFIYVNGQHRETLTFQGFHLHESVNGDSSTFSWQQWVVAQQFRQGSSQLPMIGDRVTMQAMVDAANLASGLATTTTPGRVLASVTPSSSPVAVVTDDPRVKKIVTSSQFGFVGDDSTNNDAAILALRTYLRANDGATVHFVHSSPSAKTYRYTDNMWLLGVRNVTIYFNGARLRNVTASPWNALQTSLRIGNHGYEDNTGDTTYPSGLLEAKNYINSAAARALSVTLKVTANSSKFDAGDYVFIGGFDQQGAGGPDNLRYFEVNKVASVNAGTGVITLESPLRWDYRDDWYSIPAYLISLNRSQYNVAENIRIYDVETLENPVPPPGFGAFGRNWSSGIEIHGVLNFYGRNIKTNYLGVSLSDKVTIEDSEVFYSDLDKQVDVVEFRRCRYWYFLGGTGINRITFDGGEILEQAQPNSREFVLTNSRVSGTHVSNHAKIYAPDYYSRHWTLRGNTFLPRSGETGNTGFIGTNGVTVTALMAPTSSSITIAADFNVLRSLGPGTVCRTSAGKQFTVTDVIGNGVNLTVMGTWINSVPAPGDVYKAAPLINLSLDPITNKWEGIDPLSRPMILGDGSGGLPAENWSESIDTTVHRLPVSAAAQRDIVIDGFVERVEVQIDVPYSGSTPTPHIYMDEAVSGSFRFFQVNVASKGRRTVDAVSGASGAKAGDSLPASIVDADGNARYARVLFLFSDAMASASPSELPQGFIKITVRRRR